MSEGVPRPGTTFGDLPSDDAVVAYLVERRAQLCAKRVLDALIAIALLIVLSPLLAIVAAGIRVESRGAVLFTQPRWGLRERKFTCYKFRSMRADAGARAPASAAQSPRSDGYLEKMAHDPRVMPLGRLLRRTSIDELPQLWNVVKGDMSLVGPRPLMIHMLEPYPDVRAIRCRVRPGITGLWQIHERANNRHVSSMLPYDIAYLQSLGLLLDATILIRTIQVVIRGHGAV